MINKFFNEYTVSGALVTLALMLLDPLDLFMPTQVSMMLLIALIVIFGAYCAFVWREGAQDEREGLHRLLAGRISYLLGSSVLVLGILVQGYFHALDPWLVVAFVAMIIGKIFGHLYGKNHN